MSVDDGCVPNSIFRVVVDRCGFGFGIGIGMCQGQILIGFDVVYVKKTPSEDDQKIDGGCDPSC